MGCLRLRHTELNPPASQRTEPSCLTQNWTLPHTELNPPASHRTEPSCLTQNRTLPHTELNPASHRTERSCLPQNWTLPHTELNPASHRTWLYKWQLYQSPTSIMSNINISGLSSYPTCCWQVELLRRLMTSRREECDVTRGAVSYFAVVFYHLSERLRNTGRSKSYGPINHVWPVWPGGTYLYITAVWNSRVCMFKESISL
jgi:hypothetical protein